jgi:hypothetical protein
MAMSNRVLETRLGVSVKNSTSISLTYVCYIRKCRQEKNPFKEYTTASLLDKLDVIESLNNPVKSS